MSRPGGLSGFPEWSPAQQLVEEQVLDVLRRTFSLHGFTPLHTRSVEPLSVLSRKGEIDKEVYTVSRLHADPADGAEPADTLGLHYDLTVPFARYVVERAGHLQFPFRRYQIQKVWRGERPQEGRYREFTQADIDIVGRDTLSFHHEVEMPVVMAEAFSALRGLGLPEMTIRVNNRRLAEGFYAALGLTDTAAVLRAVDKRDKIGADGVRRELAGLGADDDQAEKCLALAAIRTPDSSFVAAVRALGVSGELLEQGLDELAAVLDAPGARGLLVADLSIARGLDYYTGTVYETTMVGYESAGSVCSGGRYDTLASDSRSTYPGVGISFGLTRALGLAFGRGLTASRSVPSAVLVALTDEAQRPRTAEVAAALRARGIATVVAPEPVKFGKQIQFADRRGIPFVWFCGAGEDGADQVKDIRSGEQVDADPTSWAPPTADLAPAVVPG